VRIILDKSANKKEDIRDLKKLRDDGAIVETFHRPAFFIDRWIPSLATHRNHRKLLILDGRTAYIGSRNLQDKYFFDWHDADVRITGPVIADLTEAFHRNQRNIDLHGQKPLYVAPDLEEQARRDTVPNLQQFFDVTVQIVPEYPSDRSLPTRNGLEWTLAHAKEYFWYYNPYSPPPESTIQALKDAARRGVDVRWIAPSITDVGPERGIAESMYPGLLEAGVRIFEWQGHMMHAKQYLCDNYLTFIGSSNMDNLSLFLNYELLNVIYDERICREAAGTFLENLSAHCREVTLEEVRGWSKFRRLRNWFMRLLGGAMA
jgi:cardiolipin synthase